MNENDTTTNKQNGDDAPLFPARTFPAVYLTPGDPPAPPMVESDADQQTRARLMQEAAAANERAGAGIEAAFEKAAELDKLFVRFSEMAATPKERTEIDRFLESMRRGESGLGLAYDALLLGAKFGRDPAKDAEIQQSQKRIEDGMARLEDEQRKANELNALALRHARKMEEVARDAVANPLETALDIYQRLPLGDLARQVRRAILQTGSQRKAVKALKSSGIKTNQTKISRIVNNEILPAYAKAGIPVERVFLLRPSISYRKAPIDDEARTNPDLYPNNAENNDG